MTDALTQRYDLAAPKWDDKVTRLGYPQAYVHLAQSAGLAPNAPVVLDAGCGTGAFAIALNRVRRAARIDLLDTSQAMRVTAGRRLEKEGANTGKIYEKLFSPDVMRQDYDVVLAAHLLEHLDDPVAALAWFKTLLKPKGVILLAVSKPHWCTALIRMIWGHRAFTVSEVATWAQSAGLTTQAVAFPAGPPSRTSMGYVLRREAP